MIHILIQRRFQLKGVFTMHLILDGGNPYWQPVWHSKQLWHHWVSPSVRTGREVAYKNNESWVWFFSYSMNDALIATCYASLMILVTWYSQMNVLFLYTGDKRLVTDTCLYNLIYADLCVKVEVTREYRYCYSCVSFRRNVLGIMKEERIWTLVMINWFINFFQNV